ncbi:MAG TPA: hypothetical protein VMD75_07335 [Candidatus Binataceae bacterium]|nr:hypothetical protein [Candidatus Binataceae bacterium]
MLRQLAFYFLAIAAVTMCCSCAAPLLGGASSTTAAGAAGTGTQAAASDFISNPSMFDYTTHSTKVAFLAPAALTAENPVTEAFVVKEQCYFKTADPLFFVPDESQQPNWDFAGRLDATNHFEALEYRSILTLGLTDGNSQLNSWPVELVALSDMPQVFLQQRLAPLTKAKLQSSDEHELAQEYIRQSMTIQRVVNRLETDYNPAFVCRSYTHSRRSESPSS